MLIKNADKDIDDEKTEEAINKLMPAVGKITNNKFGGDAIKLLEDIGEKNKINEAVRAIYTGNFDNKELEELRERIRQHLKNGEKAEAKEWLVKAVSAIIKENLTINEYDYYNKTLSEIDIEVRENIINAVNKITNLYEESEIIRKNINEVETILNDMSEESLKSLKKKLCKLYEQKITEAVNKEVVEDNATPENNETESSFVLKLSEKDAKKIMSLCKKADKKNFEKYICVMIMFVMYYFAEREAGNIDENGYVNYTEIDFYSWAKIDRFGERKKRLIEVCAGGMETNEGERIEVPIISFTDSKYLIEDEYFDYYRESNKEDKNNAYIEISDTGLNIEENIKKEFRKLKTNKTENNSQISKGKQNSKSKKVSDIEEENDMDLEGLLSL